MKNVAATANGPDLAPLNVVVRIEAGRIDLTLGTLDMLAAGALLPLPGPPGRVDLLVHGTVVGTGRLVLVDDAAAVEILALAPSHEPFAHGSPRHAGRDVPRPPDEAK